MSQTNLISSAVIAPRFRRVVLPHSPGILSVAPYAVPLSFQGQQLVTVPHDATHVKLARNFGVHVDAPILHYYNWPNGPAFHAEKMTAAMPSAAPATTYIGPQPAVSIIAPRTGPPMSVPTSNMAVKNDMAEPRSVSGARSTRIAVRIGKVKP